MQWLEKLLNLIPMAGNCNPATRLLKKLAYCEIGEGSSPDRSRLQILIGLR